MATPVATVITYDSDDTGMVAALAALVTAGAVDNGAGIAAGSGYYYASGIWNGTSYYSTDYQGDGIYCYGQYSPWRGAGIYDGAGGFTGGWEGAGIYDNYNNFCGGGIWDGWGYQSYGIYTPPSFSNQFPHTKPWEGAGIYDSDGNYQGTPSGIYDNSGNNMGVGSVLVSTILVPTSTVSVSGMGLRIILGTVLAYMILTTTATGPVSGMAPIINTLVSGLVQLLTLPESGMATITMMVEYGRVKIIRILAFTFGEQLMTPVYGRVPPIFLGMTQGFTIPAATTTTPVSVLTAISTLGMVLVSTLLMPTSTVPVYMMATIINPLVSGMASILTLGIVLAYMILPAAISV